MGERLDRYCRGDRDKTETQQLKRKQVTHLAGKAK